MDISKETAKEKTSETAPKKAKEKTSKPAQQKNLHIDTKSLKYNTVLIIFIRFLIRNFVDKILKIETEFIGLETVSPPYIVLPNHSSVIDPIIYHKLPQNKLHYIVSDTHFRNPFMKFFLQQVGSISKKKNQNDIQTIREIMYVLKKQKESICIFAEWFNTWDGTSQPVVEGTASLIKLMKLPVIVAQSHGAYLTRPRWGHQFRRGKIKLTFQLALTPQEIKTMSKEEIHLSISEHLTYNEFHNQQKHPIAFPSPTRCEHIERVIFFCPHCKNKQGIVSHKQTVQCTFCKHTWFMDIYGSFHTHSYITENNLHQLNTKYPQKSNSTSNNKQLTNITDNIASWNVWQKLYLEEYLKKIKNNDIIFHDEDCVLRYGTTRLVNSFGKGRLTLTKDTLYFFPKDTSFVQQVFMLANMKGINVQNKEKLEWTQGTIVYQIHPKNLRINTYKYMIAIQQLSL